MTSLLRNPRADCKSTILTGSWGGTDASSELQAPVGVMNNRHDVGYRGACSLIMSNRRVVISQSAGNQSLRNEHTIGVIALPFNDSSIRLRLAWWPSSPGRLH